MDVREFKLINEKGQEFSLMDIENACLVTNPSGLGVNFQSQYEQLGNTFVENFRKAEQGKIPAQANFKYYDNYQKMANFIFSSQKLKISYRIPFKTGYKEYFRDVNIQTFPKSEKGRDGIISENITFDCLSLWYEALNTRYAIEVAEDDLAWDFRWNSRFIDFNIRKLDYINEGHVDASIDLTIDGEVVNPRIELYVDKELYQSIPIKTRIEKYEKLIYSSKENEFEISKVLVDGTKVSLFSLDNLNPYDDHVIRIPPHVNTEIRITADEDITNARLNIYTYYFAV